MFLGLIKSLVLLHTNYYYDNNKLYLTQQDLNNILFIYLVHNRLDLTIVCFDTV